MPVRSKSVRKVAMIVAAVMALAVRPLTAVADTAELERYLDAASLRPSHIDVTCAEEAFADRALAPIEGVWRISGSEGMLAVVADPGTVFYRIVVVDSADRSLCPGSVMGVMTALGRKEGFDALLFTKADEGRLSSPKRFTISLSDDNRLIIIPVTDTLKINLWRLLPYMFRHSVTHVNDRPNNLDGALRVYPAPAVPTDSPRYL